MKKISLFMSVILVFSFCLSSFSFAYVSGNNFFEGRISCDDTIDLSGIEIKVYSSTPFFDNNGQLHYLGDEYEFSVYTNEEGFFSFFKPSLYCTYSFSLETLPIGYGITYKNYIVFPEDFYSEADLNKILNPVTSFEGGEFQISFVGMDGEKLYVHYELKQDELVIGDLENISCKSIDKIVAYNYSGTISTTGKDYSFSEVVDLSGMSRIDKLNFLCSLHGFSEEKKMELYFEAFNEDWCEKSFCGNCINEKSDSTINHNVDSMVNFDYTTPHEVQVKDLRGNVIFKFEIFYDENVVSQHRLNLLSTICQDVYKYFCVNMNFESPIPYDGGDAYPIYIDPNLNDDAMTVSIGKKSKILIRESYFTDYFSLDDLRIVFVHEFHHAIMAATDINNIPFWISESFPTMAALAYLERTTERINSFARNYLTRSNLSIYNTNSTTGTSFSYGSFVFPLIIFLDYGGWDTISTIYYQLADETDSYEALSVNNGSIAFDYTDIFYKMIGYNCNPSYQYEHYANSGEWGVANYISKVWPTDFSGSVSPSSCMYYRYCSDTSFGNMSTTIETNGGSLMLKKILESGEIDNPENREVTIIDASESFQRAVVLQLGFSDSEYCLMTIAIANANTNGAAISFTATSNFNY